MYDVYIVFEFTFVSKKVYKAAVILSSALPPRVLVPCCTTNAYNITTNITPNSYKAANTTTFLSSFDISTDNTGIT